MAFSRLHKNLARVLLGICVVAVLPIVAVAQGSEPAATDESPARQVAIAAAVRISSPAGRFLGCGVVVASGDLQFKVLTAEHIVRASPHLMLHCYAPGSNSGVGQLVKHSSVQVLAQNPRADLALLLVKSGIPPAAQIKPAAADQPAQSPEAFSAWVIDWNQVNAIQAREVRVVKRHTARRNQESQPVSFWELAEPSRSGMSGGGLVSQQGELLGIASGNSGQHAYYSDESEIARFLEE